MCVYECMCGLKRRSNVQKRTWVPQRLLCTDVHQYVWDWIFEAEERTHPQSHTNIHTHTHSLWALNTVTFNRLTTAVALSLPAAYLFSLTAGNITVPHSSERCIIHAHILIPIIIIMIKGLHLPVSAEKHGSLPGGHTEAIPT